MGHTRKGLRRAPRADDRQRGRRSSARRPRGSSTSSAAWATSDDRASRLRARRRVLRRASGTRRNCSPRSARCSASTSPTTRSSASSTCCADKADAAIAQLTGGEHAGRRGRHHRRHHLRPAAQDDQAGQRLGHRHASRTWRAPSSACSSRRPTSWCPPSSSRTPWCSSRAGSTSARTSPRLVAMELMVPDLSDAGPTRPRGHHHPDGQGHPADGRAGSGRSSATTRATPRCGSSCRAAQDHRAPPGPAPGQPDPALFGDLKVLLGPSCLAAEVLSRRVRGRRHLVD